MGRREGEGKEGRGKGGQKVDRQGPHGLSPESYNPNHFTPPENFCVTAIFPLDIGKGRRKKERRKKRNGVHTKDKLRDAF